MRRYFTLTLISSIFVSGTAQAGMPSVGYTITEAAKLRIETLSFFLAGFFLSALGIMWLWNYLAKDFTILPRLTYGKAIVLVTLWDCCLSWC
jgi:putative Mn2+ efflux pump MntP